MLIYTSYIFSNKGGGGGGGGDKVGVREFDFGIIRILFIENETKGSWRYMYIIPEICEIDATYVDF